MRLRRPSLPAGCQEVQRGLARPDACTTDIVPHSCTGVRPGGLSGCIPKWGRVSGYLWGVTLVPQPATLDNPKSGMHPSLTGQGNCIKCGSLLIPRLFNNAVPWDCGSLACTLAMQTLWVSLGNHFSSSSSFFGPSSMGRACPLLTDGKTVDFLCVPLCVCNISVCAIFKRSCFEV